MNRIIGEMVHLKRFLKNFLITLLILLLITAAGFLSLFLWYRSIVNDEPGNLQTEARPAELGQWVNPFNGTGGIPWVCGHNFPGASRPFGMVRLCPETASMILNKRALNTSGYFYGDNKIIGFSHTRLVGTGATDGGNFLVVPGTGSKTLHDYLKGHFFHFSHHDEKAFPGYYAVKLSKPEILTELTASQRVGVHRYTFYSEDKPHILIDVGHALGKGKSKDGKVTIFPDKQELEGEIRTFGTFSGRYGGIKVYFAACFNLPFATYGTWSGESFSANQTMIRGNRIGVDLSFEKVNTPLVVELQLAISYVSCENARANLEAETAWKSFDDILTGTKTAWESKLSLIQIEGGTAQQKRIFYSALYHVFQMPTVFNDLNGEYPGFDSQVHRTTDFRYFTDLSLWDTFRTVHSLFTLVAPKDQRDMLISLVQMFRQGGGLPRWPSGNGYTGSMLGSPADIVITDSYLKGIRDFDVETAYRAMRKTALEAAPAGAPYSGRRGVKAYLKYHYCPADLMDKAVAKTLEYAWADAAISRLATALGHSADAELFSRQAQYYRNLWNPDTQYFQPRNSDGKFVKKFKPLKLTYFDSNREYTDDYVEGSALQWRWAVFFDPGGLISLFKSREYFASELNNFFTRSSTKMGAWNPGSYYWHGNEPDFHSAYLFNSVGRPDLTQKWVRWILNNKYSNTFDGLDGNDDAGTLSAWYVFSALGFYPVAGSDLYQLGAPLFRRAKLKVGENRLTIIADNFAPENKYVQKVWLNDSLLDRSWIKHLEIKNGGVLRFEMGNKPVRP